jgi:hypothetical protein
VPVAKEMQTFTNSSPAPHHVAFSQKSTRCRNLSCETKNFCAILHVLAQQRFSTLCFSQGAPLAGAISKSYETVRDEFRIRHTGGIGVSSKWVVLSTEDDMMSYTQMFALLTQVHAVMAYPVACDGYSWPAPGDVHV